MTEMIAEVGDLVQIKTVDNYPHNYDSYLLLERLIEIAAVGVVRAILPSRHDGSRLIQVEFPDRFGIEGDEETLTTFFFEKYELEIANFDSLGA